jgi:predicted Zn-dependent peptidase
VPPVYQHTLANGLTLLAEPMPQVRSAALTFWLPAGCAYDPPEHRGLGTLLAELITRGAGNRDSRALSLAMDQIGLDRDESLGVLHLRLYGVTLGRNLSAALELYADVVRRPHLPDDELEPAQALALQDLQALEDSPAQKVGLELRRRYYPGPLGNDRLGTPEGIESATPDAVRRHFARYVRPRGAILSVAGQLDWPKLREQVETLFGDWSDTGPIEEPPTLPTVPSDTHLTKETEQTQIALAYASVPIGHADYYAANGAVRVLSGGMSARLFTEVREKEGLCYGIGATYLTGKRRGDVFVSASTRPERAQETLDITVRELKRLAEGIEADEVLRMQAGLKTALIMSQESSRARAGALATDWYYLNRVRPLAEVQAAVDALTPAAIVEHLRRYPVKDFTVVTLGPRELAVKQS